jgi:hypothetical protein
MPNLEIVNKCKIVDFIIHATQFLEMSWPLKETHDESTAAVQVGHNSRL